MPTCPRSEVHCFSQDIVAGSRQYAGAQESISLLTFIVTSSLPISKVVGLATVAPPVPVFGRAVRKETTAVTGKGGKARRVRRATIGAR
ncbi:MAG: hypothetical protein PHH29_14815 [Desulfuromonadaceae bacterium]|nr:hypothetical protein [Desulfuromonadaceae bacterium]